MELFRQSTVQKSVHRPLQRVVLIYPQVKKKVKPKREQSVDSFVSLDEEIVIRKKG